MVGHGGVARLWVIFKYYISCSKGKIRVWAKCVCVCAAEIEKSTIYKNNSSIFHEKNVPDRFLRLRVIQLLRQRKHIFSRRNDKFSLTN
jgi:hypothetical protein